ncbi:hypothetical protein BDW74DRAFT_3877 [Aspergillus multicolor]|uniref:RNA polymerase II subunit A C-terminal domain phosphatase n=1 Tax=Aspergillus multicolor TaxID=41759 RepID=UPI003CCCDD74
MAYDPRLAGAGTAAQENPAPPPPPTEAAAATVAAQSSTEQTATHKLRFCTVCASNQNRSMDAHLRLATADTPFPVISFGTGSLVRLPGPSLTQPNVYNFNSMSYSQMYDDLVSKDERLYRNIGLLNMLDRNRNIKYGPERFQDWVPGLPRVDHVSKGDKGALGTEGGVVDVIITCEERCWDAVVDDLMNKGSALNKPVHVINVHIKDNIGDALVGGEAILELATRLGEVATQEQKALGAGGWENGTGEARRSFDEKVPEVLGAWQEKWPKLPALWTLAWL